MTSPAVPIQPLSAGSYAPAVRHTGASSEAKTRTVTVEEVLARVAARQKATAQRTAVEQGRGPLGAYSTWLWLGAMMTFGFGDTFSSLLVFGNGGYESNFIFATLLQILGPTLASFMLIKVVSILAVFAMGKAAKGYEAYVAAGMLGMGLFLTVHNLLHFAAS